MSLTLPPSPIRDQVRRTPPWLPMTALLLLLALAAALAWRAATAPAAGDEGPPAEATPAPD